VSFSYVPRLQYDHAGLIFFAPSARRSDKTPPGSVEAAENDDVKHPDTHAPRQWVKAGLEAKDGGVWVSVVAKTRDGWCDWSLGALPPGSYGEVETVGGEGGKGEREKLGREVGATIEMSRSKNALMVYLVTHQGEQEERALIRKVPWVFLGVEEKSGGEDDDVVCVGAFAARPDPEGAAGTEELDVRFTDFAVEVA
jgi:hypothetical protein